MPKEPFSILDSISALIARQTSSFIANVRTASGTLVDLVELSDAYGEAEEGGSGSLLTNKVWVPLTHLL